MYIGHMNHDFAGDIYAFQWSSTLGQLWKRVSGTWSQLGGNTPGFATGDVVTLKTQGTNIIVLRNNSQVLSVNDTTFTAPGSAGVGMGGVIDNNADCSSQVLDNFKVLTPN